jgi:hypothetical protein
MKTALIWLASLLVVGGIAFGIAACVIVSSYNDGFLGDCFYGDPSPACDATAAYSSDYGSAGLTLELRHRFNRGTYKRCVVAAVTDATGERVSYATVRFSVAAAGGTSGPLKATRLTGVDGQATLCFAASPPFGLRKTRVFVDTDDSGRRDPGEPSKVV